MLINCPGFLLQEIGRYAIVLHEIALQYDGMSFHELLALLDNMQFSSCECFYWFGSKS